MSVLHPLQPEEGPNIASIDPETGVVVTLFHPRLQAWRDHFRTGKDGRIVGATPEGRATVQLLEMNDPGRVQLRALLLRRGRLP